MIIRGGVKLAGGLGRRMTSPGLRLLTSMFGFTAWMEFSEMPYIFARPRAVSVLPMTWGWPAGGWGAGGGMSSDGIGWPVEAASWSASNCFRATAFCASLRVELVIAFS